MIHLKINGIPVQVDENATLLDAANAAGVEVPALCYAKETGAITSCMLCVVKDRLSEKMMPACATKALDGMDIDTGDEEVRAARREVLRLLLNEHVGDCEAPCANICPASLNIPRMLRYIQAGAFEAAARLAKQDLVFPATLGRLCSAPCEKTCRRAAYDAPVAIQRAHGRLAEQFLNNPLCGTVCAPGTRKTVAIIGAGIAGLAAAWACLGDGHACRVYEKAPHACPALRHIPADTLPPEILHAEIEAIRLRGAEFVFECPIGTALSFDELANGVDAIILACGLDMPPSNNLFTAKEDAMLVRAVAHGKQAARLVNAFLCGPADCGESPRFNAQIGRLRDDEKDAYAVHRLCSSRSIGTCNAAQAEAARCLHCDCLKPLSCKLRRYATDYGLGPRLNRTLTRIAIEPIQRGGEVLFEPGKCIKCGICIEITRARGVPLGLTFGGSGFDTRLRVPFDGDLATALGEAARECVKACPTGALAFSNEEETS